MSQSAWKCAASRQNLEDKFPYLTDDGVAVPLDKDIFQVTSAFGNGYKISCAVRQCYLPCKLTGTDRDQARTQLEKAVSSARDIDTDKCLKIEVSYEQYHIIVYCEAALKREFLDKYGFRCALECGQRPKAWIYSKNGPCDSGMSTPEEKQGKRREFVECLEELAEKYDKDIHRMSIVVSSAYQNDLLDGNGYHRSIVKKISTYVECIMHVVRLEGEGIECTLVGTKESLLNVGLRTVQKIFPPSQLQER